MSTTITFNKDKKGNVESVAIHGTTFYYTNIRTPRPIYDDRKLAYDKARKEYSVEVAVTEDIADEWDEVFAKQPSKKYTNAKFMEKYKLEDKSELPFPNEKKQFTIKITQKAQKNDGDPINSSLIPRVFLVEDKKGKDVTFDTNIGNGSKGSVLVRANTNDYGAFAYLSKLKIAIEDLVEYEGNEGLSDEEKDFLGVDEVELAEAPERKATKATERSDDDDDDDEDEAPAKSDSKKSDDVDDDDF